LTKIPCKRKPTETRNSRVGTGDNSDDSDTNNTQEQYNVDVDFDYKPVEMQDYFAGPYLINNGMNYITYPDGSNVYQEN
jgi:hypothetical protein